MQALWDRLESLATLSSEKLPETQRVFHGRGHCFEGLEFINVDYFSPVGLLLVTLYAEQPDTFINELQTRVNGIAAVRSVVLQQRFLAQSPSVVLMGELDQKVKITEHDLAYWIYPAQQQNIGFFIDMEEGRRWVRRQSMEANVLNLFSYTCAFSVAAIAGGARQVVNLDMSKPSLSKGRDNHRLNDHDLSRVKFLGHDLFKSWGKVKRLGRYDLVIIDPPSFQKGSFVATKDYQRVLKRLPEITQPGTQVLLCLNDPAINSEFLKSLMREHCPSAKYVERLPLPSGFYEKAQEKGLKTLVYKMAD